MTAPSRTAEIRALAATDADAAERRLAALLHDLFGLEAQTVRINLDRYSLNSLNGFIESERGAFFFKFHQEEGEEAMAGEYYRADILAKAGLPVDQPLHVSSLPGEQILIYRRRDQPRFSDVLRELDLVDDPVRRARAVAAERALGAKLASVYLDTLHPIVPSEAAAEPIHRLFHERLVDRDTGLFPGGRLADFYVGRSFNFPGVELDWEKFAGLGFVINGQPYSRTIGELFTRAHSRLAPARLADCGGVVAHGDAHNANVWYAEGEGAAALSLFDPAFAGSGVPALLAEVKATFHNIFAHPFWLYDPVLATERFSASARIEDDRLMVETDWALSPVRRDLLAAKADSVWRPLLAELKQRGLLSEDWREVLRLALFLCPTLVMNLRAGAATHTPVSSLIGFAIAVMVGSPPITGSDVVTDFLDAVDPAMPDRR
jgi:Ser/Thr protein kinase RdoA (MazF antagonist)